MLFFVCLLGQDSVEQTGREVGEREGGGIGKGPRVGIRTRDANNATAIGTDCSLVLNCGHDSLEYKGRYFVACPCFSFSTMRIDADSHCQSFIKV